MIRISTQSKFEGTSLKGGQRHSGIFQKVHHNRTEKQIYTKEMAKSSDVSTRKDLDKNERVSSYADQRAACVVHMEETRGNTNIKCRQTVGLQWKRDLHRYSVQRGRDSKHNEVRR